MNFGEVFNMKKRIYLYFIIFSLVSFKMFACSHIESADSKNENWCSVARVYMDDTLPELVNGEKIYGEQIRGVVYFEGFDFLHYSAEISGIEPMLEETYVLLKEYYAAENQPDKKPVPFVFLGHSQGGLRSLAMSTYLKNKDPVLYKQLKGVVTFSGIDKGLKLLENRGANIRSEAYKDVSILSNGAYATVKVCDFVPNDFFADLIINKLLGKSLSNGAYAFMELFLSEWLGATKGFAYPIMYNNNWDQYAQIRDMCPQSDFIKKYVLEEKPYYYKVATGSKKVLVWKKGLLGIPYLTLETQTVYSTVQTTDVNMKVNKDLPLKFVVGTQNDTLSMVSEDVRNTIDEAMDTTGDIFRTAQIIHIAKCVSLIGFFTNSGVYEEDCRKAADWCYSYKDQINQLIGESSNDGLVAISSQQLPEYSKKGSSYQTKVLNKSKRVFFCRNHGNIVDAGTDSRNKINDYADELLGIKNRSNKQR